MIVEQPWGAGSVRVLTIYYRLSRDVCLAMARSGGKITVAVLPLPSSLLMVRLAPCDGQAEAVALVAS